MPRSPSYSRLRVLLAGTLLGALSMNAAASDLAIGDAAPEFALAGSDGTVHRLSDYAGQTVVVAWFPKAFTGG
jgi:peroxiredoxin Q/BCP